MPRIWLRVVCFSVLMFVVAAGCGGGKKYKVTGTVSEKTTGQMLMGATVFFSPKENPNEFTARGYVGADGTYKVSTAVADDGLPVGSYRVSVLVPEEQPDEREPKKVVKVVSLIDPKYSKFDTSGLELVLTSSGPFQFDLSLDPPPKGK